MIQPIQGITISEQITFRVHDTALQIMQPPANELNGVVETAKGVFEVGRPDPVLDKMAGLGVLFDKQVM